MYACPMLRLLNMILDIFRYYSVVKIFLGMASCVGTLLGMFVCFNIVENLLRIFFPENRFLVAAITTRIFVVTLAGIL